MTVIVSWAPSMVGGVSNQVSTQSVFGTPANGCLSKNTHPFAAPCQPFFYADVTSGKGSITISPQAGYGGNGVGDPAGGAIALQQAQLGLDWNDSTMQVEQTSTVLSTAQTGLAVLKVSGSSSSTGGAQAPSQADYDPASSSPQGVAEL